MGQPQQHPKQLLQRHKLLHCQHAQHIRNNSVAVTMRLWCGVRRACSAMRMRSRPYVISTAGVGSVWPPACWK